MGEIFKSFLRMGVLGFGGPVAVMGMLEDEFCTKRKWLTTQHFSEVYALLKVMPGPVSTQMAIYIGSLRGGRLGGVVSGMAFISPAFILVLLMSVFYVHSGQKYVSAGGFFSGLQAGALVVILLSTLQLARPYLGRLYAWVLAFLAGVLVFFAPRWEPVVICGAGVFGIIKTLRAAHGMEYKAPEKTQVSQKMNMIVPGMVAWVGGLSASQIQLIQIFWTCFKAGAFVFGTGLAIVPMLEADVVSRFHWLSHAEFIDGLAMGQVTPGPIVITATFIGYKAAGWLGAGMATLGIFLPSFVNVLWILPKLWSRLSGTLAAQGFAGWAIPAVIGGILATAVRIGTMVFGSSLAAGCVFAMMLGFAVWLKPPAWLLIPIAGLTGAIVHLFL